MAKKLPVPVGLPISIIVLLILGLIAGPLIESTASEEQLNTNVLLSAIPFILIFVAILLTFITLVALVSRLLSHNVPVRIYQLVERIIIAGIALGIVGVFQPWLFALYRIGFLVVLISWLSFIVWNHVKPASESFAPEE
jgi:hypothetical protein